MGEYKSTDLYSWEKQSAPILESGSARTDDYPSGAHVDVVVAGDKA
jgi:hypothetical protein